MAEIIVGIIFGKSALTSSVKDNGLTSLLMFITTDMNAAIILVYIATSLISTAISYKVSNRSHFLSAHSWDWHFVSDYLLNADPWPSHNLLIN